MKKSDVKKIILGILFTGVSLTSCKKFMNNGIIDQRGASNDATVVGQLITGAYSDLLNGDTWGYGNDVHGFSFIAATNIISDDADKGSTSSDQPGIGEFDNLSISTSNVFVAALWKGYYFAIGDANYAIATIGNSSLDTATKAEYTAEMRYLRGYYYFNLIRMFGGVPMVLRKANSPEDLSSDIFNTRVDTSKIYDSVIVPDLQYAITHLPLKSGASVGHATRGAAEMVLAKVYLYRKSWQNTLSSCEDIINSGQYRLMGDYSLNWLPTGNNDSESVFEIEGGDFNNTDLGIQLYSECQGPRVGGKGGWTDLGWGFDTPTPSLINAYEPGDLRKSSSVILLKFADPAHPTTDYGTYLWDGFRIPAADSVQAQYYNYKAYNSERPVDSVPTGDVSNPLWKGNRDYKEKNVHLLRYAEVYLLAAEAANEMGQVGTAADYLNVIRNRAGLPNTTAVSQSDLRNAIWQERHVELALEHDRYWDLVRTGRAAAVMMAAGKPFVSNKDELLPIPAVQIALSNNRLKQNPGY
jgi:hypothetical protein